MCILNVMTVHIYNNLVMSTLFCNIVNLNQIVLTYIYYVVVISNVCVYLCRICNCLCTCMLECRGQINNVLFFLPKCKMFKRNGTN